MSILQADRPRDEKNSAGNSELSDAMAGEISNCERVRSLEMRYVAITLSAKMRSILLSK